MKQTVSESMFRDAFLMSNERKETFSYEGLTALYNYLTELEDGCSEEMELDVIALCCEYTEYKSADEAACEYFDYEGMTYDEDGGELETPEEVELKALNFLADKTTVIQFDSGIIIAEF